MLVVTRRPGEAIVIELPTGEVIEVVVLCAASNQVKLGADAPKHLPVLREELLHKLSDDPPCDSWRREDLVDAKYLGRAVAKPLVSQRLMLLPARNVIATETVGRKLSGLPQGRGLTFRIVSPPTPHLSM